MIDVWSLPQSICINGQECAIRSDFRAILDILSAYNDSQFNDQEKTMIMLKIFYKDKIHIGCLREACDKAIEFIDYSFEDARKRKAYKLMDWKQDAPILIPAINKVAGREIRSIPYLHWWTFMSLYMEIGEGLYSQVINIRNKKSKGKKLEKWEQEFYRDNKVLVDLKMKKNERSEEEKEELRELFGIKKD